jgi:hypothetical protein
MFLVHFFDGLAKQVLVNVVAKASLVTAHTVATGRIHAHLREKASAILPVLHLGLFILAHKHIHTSLMVAEAKGGNRNEVTLVGKAKVTKKARRFHGLKGLGICHVSYLWRSKGSGLDGPGKLAGLAIRLRLLDMIDELKGKELAKRSA